MIEQASQYLYKYDQVKINRPIGQSPRSRDSITDTIITRVQVKLNNRSLTLLVRPNPDLSNVTSNTNLTYNPEHFLTGWVDGYPPPLSTVSLSLYGEHFAVT